MRVALLGLVFNRYTLATLAAAGISWYGYNWIYTRGVNHQIAVDAPVIKRLTLERDSAIGLLDSARKTAEAEAKAHSEAISKLTADQKRILASILAKLDAAEQRADQLKKDRDAEIPKYITKQADANCTVPIGFVRFHNLRAEAGTVTSTTTQTATISDSGPTDVDRASTIALSAVGSVIADNYAECNARKEIVDSWQLWYKEQLASWLKAVEVQSNFQVTGPPIAAPPN